jgi:tetratricopeptide (TPR) repeat protein
MERSILIFIVFLGPTIFIMAQEQQSEKLFNEGIYQEEVKGELKKAIKVYQEIVNKFRENRPMAAKAQLHIGMCYEKLGKQAAIKAYKKVIWEFPDQEEVVIEARMRLSGLMVNGIKKKIFTFPKLKWKPALY